MTKQELDDKLQPMWNAYMAGKASNGEYRYYAGYYYPEFIQWIHKQYPKLYAEILLLQK